MRQRILAGVGGAVLGGLLAVAWLARFDANVACDLGCVALFPLVPAWALAGAWAAVDAERAPARAAAPAAAWGVALVAAFVFPLGTGRALLGVWEAPADALGALGGFVGWLLWAALPLAVWWAASHLRVRPRPAPA